MRYLHQIANETTFPRGHGRCSRTAGFTLIEVMIVVAIVAILAAIALPSYRDYVLRGQLVDATSLLSAGRANMERYFQDNRTYQPVTSGGNTIYPPCDNNIAVAQRMQGKWFVLTCAASDGDAPTLTRYRLRATGSGPVANFVYTVDATGAPSTVSVGAGWPTPPSGNTCWITKKGQTC